MGVDLPSFMAERIMPPASKANSRSANRESAGERPAEQVGVLLGGLRPLGLELDPEHRVHRPGVGVNAADQSAVSPSSLMTSSRSSPVSSLMNCSTRAIFSSVTSIRVPDGARANTSNAPASTSGKNSRRRSGPSSTTTTASRAKAAADD